jgi:aryl-alcohol dehydrogenase-like predicted oxidoreductase
MMRYGLIDGAGPRVSRIVLGTSGMRSYEDAAPILDAFLERGGTCLDTAYVYGSGNCETVVGQWLRRRGAHGQVVLIGKGAHPPACAPEHMARQLAQSLERLGVGSVDIYMPHRDNPLVPAREWVDAMTELAAQGMAARLGASNWTTARVDEVNAIAVGRGASGLVALSNHFSLAECAESLYTGCAAVGEGDAAWLRRKQFALFPWSSQARGYFSDTDPASLDPNTWRCWDSQQNRQRRDRAAELAKAFGVPVINVALAYVLAQPFPTFPLIGPRSTGELRTALGALSLDLSAHSLAWLRSGTKPAHRPAAVPPGHDWTQEADHGC